MQLRFFPFAVIAALVTLLPSIARAQVQTQRGATLGGIAGAVAGGLIGDNNGEAGAGAAIGGVLGAVTGGLLGNAADKEAAAAQQHYYYQQQQQTARMQSAVSFSDVVTMTRNGLSDAVIINQLNQRGVQQTLQVPDIIALHQQGVSENVITAMQTAPAGGQTVARPPIPVAPRRVITPQPVVVEEHYFLPHYGPPRYYYHGPYSAHRHGVRIRF